MTRTLILMRHAKAVPGHDLPTDAERPLAPKGVAQATANGELLVNAKLFPDVALVSPAVRTRQTWEYTVKKLHDLKPKRALPVYRLEDSLYPASVADVLDLVRALDDSTQTVIVVGHEPTVSAAATHLASPDSNEAAFAQVRVGVPTATWAVLTAEVPWAEWGRDMAMLTEVTRPKNPQR